MQKTKYGSTLAEDLLKQGMRVCFETIYTVYESLLAMVHCYSIYIILTNIDTLITLYLYVFMWNKINKTKIIDAINKTFLQITQVMEVARELTTILVRNDDLLGYQCNLLYFLKCLSLKSNILFNVINIVPQLKYKGIH